MKTITIDIDNKEDFFEKYNNSQVSKQLLNYIIDNALDSYSTNFKLIINSSLSVDFETLIKNGLNKELQLYLTEKYRTNLKQIMLIFLGMVLIGLSIYLKKFEIWHELILILGWVPIWEAFDIELFYDSKSRKRSKVIKKLISSSIIIKKDTK